MSNRVMALRHVARRQPLIGLLPGIALLLALAVGCQPALPYDPALLLNTQLGGETTVVSTNRNSFALPARNISRLERRTFEIGDSFFTQNWVTAPSSTKARDGLGPTFNAQSCSSCHTLDGRGQPPADADDPERGLLFRLSIPGVDPTTGGPVGDPTVRRPTARPGHTERSAGRPFPD